ncbi:cytochrome c-type biogenesis protein CcmH precursor [Variibacter gotjawalensis]|uniref:Cytochrome c-type biogenesis protein n=2 Tax=Variibacter gotjawalensis TaxID=1333996 RepID=A0A0S3PZ34_9BRAD|nr:cytochrome c-type biogenesis protein CcmH [Variibacter gotjawalensis]RZS48949.1 cytochrome c-type biogenesis protein CcmH [Variibacter gotjawalensis]BAT61207.1 cytochrome c-type biogenesis protein CcmH precursor [Variibacter gotjawalensis]
MMRAFLFAALVALAALSPFEARAVLPDEVLPNAALEARARALSRQLRCMVCQNQSIDDSDAPLARDLRVLVRERLTAGDSDEQVRDFLVARYGEFVLLSPRLSSSTALLWAAPLLVVLIGGVVVFFAAKRRRDVAKTLELRPDEKERLEALLSEKSL